MLGLAAVAITDFGSLDQRARDYIRTGESLMAGDVVFTEGGEAAANAARQVEAARLAEREAFDADGARVRKLEATAAGGAALFAALALAILAFAPAAAKEADAFRSRQHRSRGHQRDRRARAAARLGTGAARRSGALH